MQTYSTTTPTKVPLVPITWSSNGHDEKCGFCRSTIPSGTRYAVVAYNGRQPVFCRRCALSSAVVAFNSERARRAAASSPCPACGHLTDDGTCWNEWCPEGCDNLHRDAAEAHYYEAARAAEAYYHDM